MSASFQVTPLTDMVAVGKINADRVRLWMRSEHPGPLRVTWWSQDDPTVRGDVSAVIDPSDGRDHTTSIILPGPEASPFRPLHRYRYRVTQSDGHEVGSGTFETAPADAQRAPDRFSIGLFSCNQPFAKDGACRPQAASMVEAAHACFAEHDVKLVLAIGDQIYSDYPAPLSLLNDEHFDLVAPHGRSRLQDCSVEEVRRLYQQRYRTCWSVPGWTRLHASFPCYPMLDDHDIIDNWGSSIEHQHADWQRVGRGARRAYQDYQASRLSPPSPTLPDSFHYSFTYGPLAAFVMDLRSQRRVGDDGQIFSAGQEQDLRAFLQAEAHRPILMLGLTVPMVHLPRRVARLGAWLTRYGEEFSDRWSTRSHLGDRDRLLHLLHDHCQRHPHQRLLIMSGDIHSGCAHELRWRGDALPPAYQFVSSPLTNSDAPWLRLASTLLMRTNRSLSTRTGSLQADVRLLPGTGSHRQNPYRPLNVGVLEVEAQSAGHPPRFRFHLYGHEDAQPIPVYRSPWCGGTNGSA